MNRDHCPPKGLFAKLDRINFPVILPTHHSCNHLWQDKDHLVGILADALHTRQKSQDTSITKRLEAYLIPFNGIEAPAVSNVPLAEMGFRIVRGMHALLYKAYLPHLPSRNIHVPLPTANAQTGEIEQPLDQAFVFSESVRRALLTNTADQVMAYNRQFRYACIWDRMENGDPLCIFAFDIYRFHYLSPAINNFPKCFVGSYVPDLVPSNASWASDIDFKISRDELLDPWQRV